MATQSSFTALAVVVLMLVASAPAVTGEWSVHGTIEPDTPQDAAGGFMFTSPDTSPSGARVYFNALGNFYSSGINPNSAQTGSRIMWFPFENPGAYLGVWKDCNADGYIGMAAGALSEYRAQLLESSTICPVGSQFNDGAWVYEFLWIAPQDNSRSARATMPHGAIIDPDAKVWGDIGLPGEPSMAHLAPCELLRGTSLTGGATMPYRGWTSNTGVMLQYADCWTGHTAARAVTELDVTGQLGFEDPTRPHQSSSMLDQDLPVSVFGNPYAGQNDDEHQTGLYDREGDQTPAATVWDCDEPTGTDSVRDPTAAPGQRGALSTVTVADPTPDGELAKRQPSYFEADGSTDFHLTSDDGAYAHIPRVAPSVDDPTGNWYATVNHTEEGATYPMPDVGANRGRRDACETDHGDYDSVTYTNYPGDNVEGPRSRADETLARRYNEYTFSFNSFAVDAQHIASNETDTQLRPLGDRAPANLGIDLARFNTFGGAHWTASFRSTTIPLLDRHALGPAPAQFETFYARVGTATIGLATLPPSAPGIYGSEWCPLGAGSGVQAQFDCDAANWWNLAYDPTSREPRDSDTSGRMDGTTPGDAYHLRDIDCDDNSAARAAPLSVSSFSEKGGCVWP